MYTGEEDAKADKEFELLQEINVKIGKGVCDNIKSKETKKKKAMLLKTGFFLTTIKAISK